MQGTGNSERGSAAGGKTCAGCAKCIAPARQKSIFAALADGKVSPMRMQRRKLSIWPWWFDFGKPQDPQDSMPQLRLSDAKTALPSTYMPPGAMEERKGFGPYTRFGGRQACVMRNILPAFKRAENPWLPQETVP